MEAILSNHFEITQQADDVVSTLVFLPFAVNLQKRGIRVRYFYRALNNPQFRNQERCSAMSEPQGIYWYMRMYGSQIRSFAHQAQDCLQPNSAVFGVERSQEAS